MDDHSGTPASHWPAEELELLGRCPACGDPRRTLMFRSLTDLTYGVAPGTWTMWRCLACFGGYLDPRPSRTSIGEAYTKYSSHRVMDAEALRYLITGTDIATRLRTGYYNQNYGYKLENAWSIGAIVGALAPRKRTQWDYLIRHLPAPSAPGESILDVGCGNGSFLQVARGLGYLPVGLEPDPAAVEVARAAGLDVRMGGLPVTGLPESGFDQITLSHVFEHVHDPFDAANELLRLLKPGGRIWFTQPNIDAAGLSVFGEHWRGLEVPRHLLLLNVDGFKNLLGRAGFVDVELLPARLDAVPSYSASLTIREGTLPHPSYVPKSWDSRWRKRARQADKKALRDSTTAESLTIVARKPLRI